MFDSTTDHGPRTTDKRTTDNGQDLELDRLYDGDCLEQFRRVRDGSVDLVFADPPFNIGYEYDTYDDRRRRRLPGLVAAVDGRRWSACSSPTAPSGWRSATNTPPS